MSADVEAATADPATVESKDTKADDVKAAAATSTEEEKKKKKESEKNGDGRHDDKNGRSGRFTDDGYSKSRKGFQGKKGGYNGNFRRNKFDRSNVKSRYDQDEKTSDPVQIRKQVEFYFSDGNLRQDKFLFEQIGGSENRAVDIKVIASFKRMQRFEPYSAIVAALKASSTLEVLNEDKPNDEQVRRKKPLPENLGTSHDEVRANYEHESMKRSIYAKGFGDETSKTQVEIEQFFAPYMASAVRLRRANDGTFKGSVFVEFESEEDMQQFLELDDKPEWDGKPLQIKSKAAYCKEKDNLINEGKIRRNDLDEDDSPHGGKRGGFRGSRGRGRGNFRGRRDRDRARSDSRSRSRSRGRRGSFHKELRHKNWRELADEEDRERESKEQKQEYDDAGIPKVMSAPKKAATEKTEDAATNGKKRALEDSSAENGGELKKAKVDEEP